MDNMARVLCPFCYSSDLKVYTEHSDNPETNEITAENIGNSDTELICTVCKNVFKGKEALLPPDPNNSFPPEYHEEAIGYLNPDERFIFEMCREKDKFTAVKYCVTTYGWGLKEAKDYVDEIMDRIEHNRKKIPISEADIDEEEVVRIIENQGKIQAIKFVRDKTRQGLKESKEYVDSLQAIRNIKTKKEGCFIATACYGNYDALEVLALRLYRDKVLSRTFTGKMFIKTYYKVSPPIALLLVRSAKGKFFVRKYLLAPLVRLVNRHRY